MSVRAKAGKRNKQSLNDARPHFTGDARPKYVLEGYNVFEAALDRIRWLFNEFDGKVMVCNSGGKDSTVVLELALIVARERGELPLHVQWLDQETEFQATVDYQTNIMDNRRDEIDFHWYQIPFYLENASNSENPWLHAWGPGEEWVRPKHPRSIHDNTYGEQYFNEILSAINSHDWDGCLIDGIRSEESPARRLTSESRPMYRWVTWSAVDCDPKLTKDPSYHRFRFHPIYDWRYFDIWKAIHDNKWRYNEHYDHLFQYGVPIQKMRVSNYHHDSALGSLVSLQEIEPQTWEAATRRLEGINTYGHIGKDQFPKSLPYMFKSWTEYMHHLIDNLVPADAEYRGQLQQDIFRDQFRVLVKACPWDSEEELAQQIVGSVIGGDPYGTHVGNYVVTSRARNHKKVSEGG